MAGALSGIEMILPETFAAIEKAAVDSISEFKSLDLAMITHAFAQARVPCEHLFGVLELEAGRRKALSCSPL
jgi:hypothetical protein